MSGTSVATVVALLLGALVAIAELVSRYRDDPARAVWSVPAALYVAVNAAASLVAFWLIRVFGWTFDSTGSQRLVTQVLVAGFGSAALFRSSLFNITAGNQVIGVGPGAVLTVMLNAADRAVDRQRARIRAQKTTASMEGISFEKSADALVVFCFGAMQNASNEEVRALEDRIGTLHEDKNRHVPDQVKSYVLGLALATVVGDKVLSEAARHIRAVGCAESELAPAPQASPPVPDPATPEATVLHLLAGGRMPTTELQAKAGIEITSFGPLMKRLADTGVVAVGGSGDLETAELVT